MTIYKVRNKETGLFSTGGMAPKFNDIGKTWNKLNHVRAHLAQFKKGGLHNLNYLFSVEIVEYDLENATINVIS